MPIKAGPLIGQHHGTAFAHSSIFLYIKVVPLLDVTCTWSEPQTQVKDSEGTTP